MNRPGPPPADLVERLLGESSAVLHAELDGDGRIARYNRAFARLLDGCLEPRGILLSDALLPESRAVLARAAAGTGPVRLNFQWRDGPVHSADCWLGRAEDGLVLVGVLFMLSNERIVEEMTLLNNDLANLSRELSHKNAELERAREEVRTLTGLIPICAYCKKIRDDGGAWRPLETYLRQHSTAEFSHGMCPGCFARVQRELDQEEPPGGGAGAPGGQAV